MESSYCQQAVTFFLFLIFNLQLACSTAPVARESGHFLQDFAGTLQNSARGFRDLVRLLQEISFARKSGHFLQDSCRIIFAGYIWTPQKCGPQVHFFLNYLDLSEIFYPPTKFIINAICTHSKGRIQDQGAQTGKL